MLEASRLAHLQLFCTPVMGTDLEVQVLRRSNHGEPREPQGLDREVGAEEAGNAITGRSISGSTSTRVRRPSPFGDFSSATENSIDRTNPPGGRWPCPPRRSRSHEAGRVLASHHWWVFEDPSNLRLPPVIHVESPVQSDAADFIQGDQVMTVQRIAQLAPFLFLFLVISAHADVNVTNNPQSFQTECSISADPMNPQHVVISGHPGSGSHLNVYFTTDGGATWDSTHIDARIDGHSASNQRGDPSVAFATTGDTVYVAYLSRVSTTVLRTYCVRSVDGGQSFTASALVASGGGNMDKPFVATGPNANGSGHNVYLAYDNGGLILSRSTNPSTFTFSHSSPLSGSSFPAFAVPSAGADGVVCVTYRGAGNDGLSESIHIAYSDDEGATFSTGYSIAKTYVVKDQTPIPAAPAFVSSVPSIAIDRSSGRTHVAFATSSYGTADVDIAATYSDDPSDPASWSTPRIVHKSSKNSQFHPWLTIDQSTGDVGIVYYDGRNDSNNEAVETWVSASGDGGETWYDYPLSAQASDATESAPGNYYREYIGATAVSDTLMAVWSHYPTVSFESEFYFDRVAFDVVISPDTIYVPDPVTSIADAIEQAQAGDVVLVSGSPADQPILGEFELSSWVKVAPEPGTGTPVLDADGASCLATFPTRYTG